VNPSQAEGWLRGIVEDVLMDQDATLETVRAAAGTLVAVGVLAEARADNVWAEAACSLALRGRAPLDHLAARDPVRGAAGPTRRGRPVPTVAKAYQGWVEHRRGRAPLQAYVRTGQWARLVGLETASALTDGEARLRLVDTNGREAAASTTGPAVGDGWGMWSLTLDPALDDPILPRSAPAPADHPPTVHLQDCPPPQDERPGAAHLRRACGAALAALAAGDDPTATLRITVDAVLAARALEPDDPSVTAARALITGRDLPGHWSSILEPSRPRAVPARAPTVGSSAPIRRRDATISVVALVPGRESFAVSAHVWPWNPTAAPTRANPGDNSLLSWWADDDAGRAYVGRRATTVLADRERFGSPADVGADIAVVFRPPIDPAARSVTLRVT
jgi:hypothetical protein